MIPRTLFSSDHELFRDSVRKFLEQEAVPFHAQWEKDGHVDRQLWSKAGEAGMLCSHIPEEYGGMAADFLYSTVVIEEIGRLGLTGIGFSLHSDIVAPYILHYGSEALKHKYLPKLVSGEMVTAIAMTEPGAGSDLQGVKTTAVLDGDGEHFCAGLDLGELKERDAGQGLMHSRMWHMAQASSFAPA